MTEPPNLYGYLTLLKNDTFIHKYKLSPKAWTIGGGLSNNIRILIDDDRFLSTQCILLVQDNGVTILKNKKAVVPITVNKKKLNECKILEPGDIIEISTKRFLYENDVLTKKKIKELSRNITPGFVITIPSASKPENRKSLSRKSQSSNPSNKNMEFNSEEVTPDKLLPTKNSQLISTSFSKTPMPDRSCNKPSTRLTVSTGKIYKFKKPTTKFCKTEKVTSHIPVLNKNVTSSNATSKRIKTKIKLEGVFNNSEPLKSVNKKRSIIESSSTEATPLKCKSTSLQNITTPNTSECATRKRNSSQNFDTSFDSFINDSSLQLNSSSVSKRRTSMQKSVQNNVSKAHKTAESSFEVSYILNTPASIGEQKKLSKSSVLTPEAKISRRSSRKCITEIKNRSRRTKSANKSVSLATSGIQIKSSPNKKLFSRSEAVENLTEISNECISDKEDEVNSELNKSSQKLCRKSKRHTNNQINENDMKISDNSVKASCEQHNSSTNVNRKSIRPLTNEDEEILIKSYKKSNRNNKKEYDPNSSQYSDQESFEFDRNESKEIRKSIQLKRKLSEQSNTIDDLKEEGIESKVTRRKSTRSSIREPNSISEIASFSEYFEQDSYEQNISINSNVNISSSSEQDNSKTSKRVSNYNKENFKPEESIKSTVRVSTRRSNKQAVEELIEKSNSFNDYHQENLKSDEKITTKHSLKEAENHVEVLNSSTRFENMSLHESTSKINRKSARRNSKPSCYFTECSPALKSLEEASNQVSSTSLHLRRSDDFSSNQSNNDSDKLNISGKSTQKSSKALRVSSMIKFSPITSNLRQKSKTPAESELKDDESLFSTSVDKENTLVTEITTEELNSSEEIYRTPDSVAKIPKQIPKTPKSNVKSRKSVFLQEFESNGINTNNLVGNETNNDTTVIDNNIRQTPNTPKSNRKVRVSDKIPVGQPSIVKDLRKSIASPENNLKNKSSLNESFQHSSIVLSKSVASINGSLMEKSEKTPYSRTKRPSSTLQLSPKTNKKLSIRSSLASVSTPKSNIKIRHSVTFEITTDDLKSLAQSSPRESNGVNLSGVSKAKEFGSTKQLRSKKRQRSSINLYLPEKRQKIDDKYSSFEDEYNQQVLQDISNDSSFEDYIVIEKKTPTSIESKAFAVQKRGFTEPKKYTDNKKYKRRSLPSEILSNQENKSLDYAKDNDYSFISSTDTSSILFEYHPATNANNLLENNITLKSSSLNMSGIGTPTPKKKILRSASEKLSKSRSSSKIPNDECDKISAITEGCKMPENVSVSGSYGLPVAKVLKTTRIQKEPASSYENVAGLKKLFRSPKQQREPVCSYENIQGVKQLFKSPKHQREPSCSYEDVRGVKRLLKTPTQQKEPACSYEDVRGVKRLLKTPKQQKEPVCSYEDVQGVKQLFKNPKHPSEPSCSYEDVRGVKRLLKTPTQQKEPACSYEDVRGVKRLLKTPKQQKQPVSSYENVEGVMNLFKTPKMQKDLQGSYENVDGIEELFKTPLLTYSRIQKAQSPNKTNITNTPTPANSFSESEDAEKEIRPLRRTRRQIKTKKYESEPNDDNKSRRKETRNLRKNVEISTNIDEKNKIEATEASTKNSMNKIVATEIPTKNLNADSSILDEEVVKPRIRTRRVKNIETEIADTITNEEEIQRPNTRTRRGVKEEKVLEGEYKKTARKQVKCEEIDVKRETEKEQPKEGSDTVAKKIKGENISFETDNSECHKNVITNLIQKNRSRRRKAHEDENSELNHFKNETPAIRIETPERRQPRRKKAEISQIAHNSFEDTKNENNMNSNNDENAVTAQRKLPKRRKVTDINEIENDTSENIKNKIDAPNSESQAEVRKKRPRRKNDDVTQAETEMHQNNVVAAGRILRTRRQKKTDTIDVDKTEEHKENVDSLSAKKTAIVGLLEEEQQVRRSKRTPKTRKVAFENNSVGNSPVVIRETRKRTRKVLSRDDIEAASEIMPETEKKCRTKAAVKTEEKITPIRKSTRQRR